MERASMERPARVSRGEVVSLGDIGEVSKVEE